VNAAQRKGQLIPTGVAASARLRWQRQTVQIDDWLVEKLFALAKPPIHETPVLRDAPATAVSSQSGQPLATMRRLLLSSA
jgi:hypothetical protein